MQISNDLRVVVTGANGQLGKEIVELFSDKVLLFPFDKLNLNITCYDTLRDKLKQIKPNIIINTAAYTAVDKAESDYVLADSINRIGAENLAKISKEIDSVLIHVSTDYVFDGLNNSPYVESDLANPQSIYGKTKLAGEIAVINNCQKFIILRTAWVFSQYGSNFVKTMLRLAVERESIGIVCDQFGGPTYAGDISKTILKIILQLENNDHRYGIYHYTGYPYVSWYEFAEKIFSCAAENKQLAKVPVLRKLITSEYPTAAKRPNFSKLNCSKIFEEFDIKPSNWIKAIKDLDKYR